MSIVSIELAKMAFPPDFAFLQKQEIQSVIDEYWELFESKVHFQLPKPTVDVQNREKVIFTPYPVAFYWFFVIVIAAFWILALLVSGVSGIFSIFPNTLFFAIVLTVIYSYHYVSARKCHKRIFKYLLQKLDAEY